MSASVNWAQPVYGSDSSKASEAYLQQLQSFLEQQQQQATPNSNTNNTKRKATSESDSGSSSALKDRKQSGNSTANHHSHNEQRGDSPESSKAGKGSAKTSDKRKEQNRNAQRAFRERKERVMKDLEDKIGELTKFNEEKVSENTNLKELVTHLQQENARLQRSSASSTTASGSSAPQTNFTFSVPSTSSSHTSPPQPDISTGSGSLTDADIMAFLSAGNAASGAPTPQHNFTMIEPSASSSLPLGDDWLWNASTFGTEIPQAIPPSVINMGQRANSFTSLGTYLPGAPSSSASASQPQSQRSSLSPSNETPQGNKSTQLDPTALYNSIFNSFSPSNYLNTFNGSGTAASPTDGSARPPARVNSNTSKSTGSTSSIGNNNLSAGNLVAKHAMGGFPGSTAADSPETTCSSSGSDPSDHHPDTPSNGSAYVFGGVTVDSPNAAGNLGWLGSGSGTDFSSFGASSGGFNATTPSSIFDMMNYRDPLFADQYGSSQSQDNIDLLQFNNFLQNNKTTQPKPEPIDFSDFLVQSPASTSVNSPAVSQASHDQHNRSERSSASSSLPALSHSSSASSSYAKSNGSSPASAVEKSPTDYLPYDITYGHPLIQHTFGGGYDPACPDNELDSLCMDMKLKATCRDVARERIAKAIQSDEATMKLYSEYMQAAQSSQ